MPNEQSPIRAELDRVGASFRKAGAANYFRSNGVKLNGPLREVLAARGSAPSGRRLSYYVLCRMLACRPCGGR